VGVTGINAFCAEEALLKFKEGTKETEWAIREALKKRWERKIVGSKGGIERQRLGRG